MTGLEILGIGGASLALYEADKKHGLWEDAKDTLKNPFIELSFKNVLALLIFGLAVVYIWQSVLKGYITE